MWLFLGCVRQITKFCDLPAEVTDDATSSIDEFYAIRTKWARNEKNPRNRLFISQWHFVWQFVLNRYGKWVFLSFVIPYRSHSGRTDGQWRKRWGTFYIHSKIILATLCFFDYYILCFGDFICLNHGFSGIYSNKKGKIYHAPWFTNRSQLIGPGMSCSD